MDKAITYRELDEMSRALGAWLQSKGLQEGRARRHHDAEHPADTRSRSAAILRAGYTVVNVNPLYTPRELEHQLKDSGAEAIVIAREFRHHAAAGDRQDAGQARRSSPRWATCSASRA